MNEKKKKERSVISWLADFAGSKKAEYAVSVIAALLGVACSLFPYFIMIELIGQDGLYRKFVVERRKAIGWKV